MKLKNALLLQPLSASKMSGGLSPDAVLSRYFGNISGWVREPTNDVAIVFTSGLYQNNESANPRQQRMSLLQREGEWRIRFEKLLRKNADQKINGYPLMREGFSMSSWDEQIASGWKDFSQHLEKLKEVVRQEGRFKSVMEDELKKMGREPTEANIAFLLEEVAVTALWVDGNINIQKGLRTEDRIDALHLVYPSPLSKFMHEGLSVLLKNKKGCLPLVWLDTSDAQHTVPTEYRFGRDRPAAFM